MAAASRYTSGGDTTGEGEFVDRQIAFDLVLHEALGAAAGIGAGRPVFPILGRLYCTT